MRLRKPRSPIHWLVDGGTLAVALIVTSGCLSAPTRSVGDGGSVATSDGGNGGRPDREWAHWPIVDRPVYTTTAQTVTDTGTGLIWERAVPSETFRWQEAADHCAGLATAVLGGYADWRLPSEIELISIIDVTRAGTWVDPLVFPRTPIDQHFWSSSPHASVANEAWGARWGMVTYLDTGDAQQVRCVRGDSTPTGSHYAISQDVVRDNWTGLTWQRTTPFAAKTWSDAKAYCAGLSLGGGLLPAWRLATYKELLSLIAWRARNPALEPDVFPAAGTVTFWSASSSADSPSMAYSVDFGSGVGLASPQSGLLGIRCVHY